ncbi:MAG: hypothetical protein IJ689_04765 [Alphaproteobacteria bacterium]|nr:hypothetical protein [Alphaproteobacteria bacterium]
MKKYILLIGAAAVSIGSYAAYADNSATMTVTAKIEHDVSLTKTKDLNLGTITIDPSQHAGQADIFYDGTSVSGGVLSVSGTQFGEFTANIPDPSTDCYDGACNIIWIESIAVDNIYINTFINYANANRFIVDARIQYSGQVEEKTYSETVEITYNW